MHFSMVRMSSKFELSTTEKFNKISFKSIEHRWICKNNIQFFQFHFQQKRNQFWSRIYIHNVVEPRGNWFLSHGIFQSVDDAPYSLVLLACCIFHSDNKLQPYFRYLSYLVISPYRYPYVKQVQTLGFVSSFHVLSSFSQNHDNRRLGRCWLAASGGQWPITGGNVGLRRE